MKEKWVSTGMYEHPGKSGKGIYGYVVLSQAGVYCLRVDGGVMSCSQTWAAEIHYDETQVYPASIQAFMAAGKAQMR